MKKTIVILAASILAMPVSAKDTVDMDSVVGGFAGAVVASQIAAAKCRGMAENIYAQNAIWRSILSHGGSAEILKKELAVYSMRMSRAFLETGQEKWCSAVWTLYGPDGTMKTIRADKP